MLVSSWCGLVSRVATIAALLAFALVGLISSQAQTQMSEDNERPREIQRPIFKKRDLQAEHRQNLKDTALLAQLVDELKRELEKANPNVLSAAAAKKATEIEKVLKRIRSNLR
jgi:dynactin complex subunit